jgi:hypothetical protein
MYPAIQEAPSSLGDRHGSRFLAHLFRALGWFSHQEHEPPMIRQYPAQLECRQQRFIFIFELSA